MPTPNILWICTDQQRWDTLGCYGNPFVHTPHLDALAAAGACFDHACCQSPVCTPSRASFLTGRYPRTTRCRQNGQDIPPDEIFVTRLLAEAGYACGLSGKLHTAACHPSVCPGGEPRIDDGYEAFHWSHHAAGGWGEDNEYHAWLSERGHQFATRPCDASCFVGLGMPEELHQTTWCVDKAIDFIDAHAGRPWLFSVNLFDPHHGFDPPAELLRPYLDRLDEIPLPDYVEGELDGKPPAQRVDHAGAYGGRCGYAWDEMSPRDHRVVRAAYWAMVDLIDRQVGRLLAHLDATGQRQNTLVIFSSDHGELLGDHGIYLKGPFFYEPAVRVPLIIQHAASIAPGPRHALVELVDLAPTLLEAAGLPVHPGMQGRSLWPLLRGDTDHHRDDLYCEYYNAMPWHRDPTAQTTMLRTRDHKLVVDHSHHTGELYDLVADPGEHRNLWHDPASLSLKADLLLRLTHRMAWTVDPLPPRRADW